MKNGEKKRQSKSVYKPIVPALEEAGRVLLCLGQSSTFRMTLTEICKKVGIHTSKAFSILNTLKQFGFVEKDPQTKTYSLGIGLVFLSRQVLDNLDYRGTIDPYLRKLAKETNGIAFFGLLQGESLYVIAKQEGDQRIGLTVRLGHRFHFTYGVHGKLIAAYMTEAERQKLMSRKHLYFHGDPSRLDITRLHAELAKCRELGFTVDAGRINPGINAIGAPVFGVDGNITGVITLIGTFPDEMIDEYGRTTSLIARQVSSRLGADNDILYSQENNDRDLNSSGYTKMNGRRGRQS
ncbi:MAG: IclR family transcriptional regulator [Desulfobacteraceae bacterium]|nr:MAG: IclR family transcriptional regulator [Desulfobacteraceae bacterium]